ncbi:preprotein translocase subunit YajC [Bhargavaea cecembensis]|uniref:preprotein translocase subunit YajC n=1 Tax=Bhargavaea cecembensis TaxID=394098 RepID=UPI0005906B4E|nr:preprotein translocase subunit YajC [Bhargavaea cecembensis]
METLVALAPLILMFAVMWFFLIRPAQKRQKNTQKMQSELKRGDDVVTIGGLHGTIDAVDDSTVFLKCSDGSRLQFERAAIGRVVNEA